MEPLVFIDSLDNISIVNLDVPSLSSPSTCDDTNQLALSECDVTTQQFEMTVPIPSIHDLFPLIGPSYPNQGYDIKTEPMEFNNKFDNDNQFNNDNQSNNELESSFESNGTSISYEHDEVSMATARLELYNNNINLNDINDMNLFNHNSNYNKHKLSRKLDDYSDYRSLGSRRTISSLDKVRTWKKYAKKKNLSQLELDKKRDLANKQERKRMHRLNHALDRLREVIPSHMHLPPRRLSKIKTLKLAIAYIQSLMEMLQSNR